MTEAPKQRTLDEIHIGMWKHYDDLRQKKHSTFLTANALLGVIIGFSGTEAADLGFAVPVVGIFIDAAWFLMLTRNDAYIEFHRSRVGEEWRPGSWTPRSSMLDRFLPTIFGLFWAFLLVTSFVGG